MTPETIVDWSLAVMLAAVALAAVGGAIGVVLSVVAALFDRRRW